MSEAYAAAYSVESALEAAGLVRQIGDSRIQVLSDGTWGVQWIRMDECKPEPGENLIFWVENNMQDVPGRWQYAFDKYLCHAIEKGQFEVTHWARVNIPEDSRHANKAKVLGKED